MDRFTFQEGDLLTEKHVQMTSVTLNKDVTS